MYAWTDLKLRSFMATVSQTIPGTETTPTIREAGPEQPVGRNVSIDAYRGFVRLLMMAEVLQLSRVAAAYSTSLFWEILAFNQTHVEWFSCSLHDTIQPGFSFRISSSSPARG
jgi:heparan-alpha-glucosaminide N-acetyltransferase